MGDTEQDAIDALHAAGLENEALAVEQLRGRHKITMDAYHAGQRASYAAGQAEAAERNRIDWDRVHHSLAKHGAHPGRTDDHLADVIDLEFGRLQAERDNLMQTLRDEMDENLRLRELGGARPDENITAMTERVIGERTVLARWMAEALLVLSTLEGEDSEDGGESLRMLRDRGDRLVKAVLHGGGV